MEESEDRESLEEFSEARVAQQPYVYQTQPTSK